MRTISEIVTELIQADESSIESLRQGLLNLSAYADKVKPIIEKKLYKSVQKGSIVTALSRMVVKLPHIDSLHPYVRIENMNIKSPLCELTYERTKETIERLSKLPVSYMKDNFFTVTQGVGEITLIFPEHLKSRVINHFKIKQKGEYDNLVAITLQFDEATYIEVPNMIFTLIASLAVKRINLIEVVSTFTEISFIVRHQEFSQTVDILKEKFK